MKRIAVEEHISIKEYIDYLYAREVPPRLEIIEDKKMGKATRDWVTKDIVVTFPFQAIDPADTGHAEKRISDMDKAGIDIQILSMRNPGVEEFDAVDGIFWAGRINDEIAGFVNRHPDRFAAFATIPWQDTESAVKELERAVRELGMKGVKTNSHIKGDYLDNKKYWPIFKTAEKLDVPVFIHPREPSPDMIKPYMAYPWLFGAVWGYGAEVGLHAMRLICSGLFDEFPKLKIILGHMGEGIPFWLWRIDNQWKMTGINIKKKPGEYFRENFFLSTSGMCSHPAFMCAYMELGADNIMFAVDYPIESAEEAVNFMDSASICKSDKEKIYHLNAEKLFKL